jgi:hypothetical protein
MATKSARLKRIVSAKDAPVVGVALTITEGRNTHVGLIYRDDEDKVWLLHLAFHCELVSEVFPASYICADPELEYEDAEAVAGHCRLIADDMPTIRFALHYNPKATFSRSGNRMLLLKEGKGLNCSTFVLTVFQSAGPRLINKDGWPKRDSDKSWQKHLVEMLSKRAPAWHTRRVAKDIGCARIRPEEVAGACLEDVLPAQPAAFAACERNSLIVIDALQKHTRRTARTSW